MRPIGAEELEDSLKTGFLDQYHPSIEDLRPKLLINNSERGQKVLTSIINELQNCSEFFFSVAFITLSGVTALLNTLSELDKKGIKGKLIASQYLNFTEPEALRKLLTFTNIELRILVEHKLHAKGYLFKQDNHMNLIVGSSNLTQDALGSNKEWNIRVSSMEEGSIVTETLAEFEELFHLATPVNGAWIDAYGELYKQTKTRWLSGQISSSGHELQVPFPFELPATDAVAGTAAPHKFDIATENGIAGTATPHHFDISTVNGIAGTITPYRVDYSHNNIFPLEQVMPNKMQVRALKGIEALRLKGKEKALLISATGTGKTYLAGFDVKKVMPRRCLFLAHREQILDQSKASFQRILGPDAKCGKFVGSLKDWDAQYLFSTVQTMSKENVLAEFKQDYFDYIIVDETHRAGAMTYQRILQHFKPKFLLGMTATPERTDGHNIFSVFDYNIAYEIRLQEAMKEEMLCPFHYFGVSEVKVDGKELDDSTEFKYLVAEERVKNVIEKAIFYGYHGDSVKGLIFCSRNEEAAALSKLFNNQGYQTLALSGEDSQGARESAIERLEQDEVKNRLDYIFTVDIFNEGVDIPKINQIIMLRPTQSAIIFVQQLGRGLRKSFGKDFVVILDFIGNYKRNFMIPVALSDDRSFNKDTVRRYVVEGSKVIPGCSTVNFDAISKRKIFESIDQIKPGDIKKIIKDSYTMLKYRLGHVPKLMDFEEHDSLDVALLFENYDSYGQFLMKCDNEDAHEYNEEQLLLLRFISTKMAIGKRPHELLALKVILEKSWMVIDDALSLVEAKYHLHVLEKTKINLIHMLTNCFSTGGSKETFKSCIFIEREGEDYRGSANFMEQLMDPVFNETVLELVQYGLYRYEKYYGKSYNKTSFQLNQKYSYEDVCRMLEWQENVVAQNIGGYKYDESTKTFPVFINYNKDENISDSIKYHDRFESPSRLVAISKARRYLTSNDVQTIYSANETGVEIHLFVRKDKNDEASKEFYYLGRMNPVEKPMEITMAGSGLPAVELFYQLDTPVREDLYEYITGD